MANKHKEYNESELADKFGLERVFGIFPRLNSWLESAHNTEIEYPKLFEQLHTELIEKVDYWNEDELEFFFIGPLIKNFINYRSKDFLVYAERTISAIVKGEFLKVEADLIIAKGKGEVLKTPYFCFHEYKRTKKNPADPIAQVLEAMLIAQEMNKNGKPVYGAYVIGKDWYFMVMEGKEYCISESYSATNKQELLQIIAILREFRVILETTLL